MKLKLVTIGILALLLCATVPIAATAAPAKTTVTKPVYFYTIGTFALGPKAGSITYNPDPRSGAYSLTLNSHLAPYTQYTLAVATITTNNGAQSTGLVKVNTDPHGHLRTTGTFTPDELTTINTYLQPGGYFVVYLPI